MTRLVVNAHRVQFNCPSVPRNVANAPSRPRWHMRAGLADNDNPRISNPAPTSQALPPKGADTSSRIGVCSPLLDPADSSDMQNHEARNSAGSGYDHVV